MEESVLDVLGLKYKIVERSDMCEPDVDVVLKERVSHKPQESCFKNFKCIEDKQVQGSYRIISSEEST